VRPCFKIKTKGLEAYTCLPCGRLWVQALVHGRREGKGKEGRGGEGKGKGKVRLKRGMEGQAGGGSTSAQALFGKGNL
jgi:hypothetical protein